MAKQNTLKTFQALLEVDENGKILDIKPVSGCETERDEIDLSTALIKAGLPGKPINELLIRFGSREALKKHLRD